MPTLVLHTSGDPQLLQEVAAGLTAQRRPLRRQGIGLRFRGTEAPARQWQRLAAAFDADRQPPWQQALRWQRHWPRDTWLCSPLFHRGVLREARFNHWREWLERHDLQLIMAVHLRSPQQQSWQRFVRQTLRLKRDQPAKPDEQRHQRWHYNALYNGLIETAGVRGARFLLHTATPPAGMPPSAAAALDQTCWPTTEGSDSASDLRAFALSLALLQQMPDPGIQKRGRRRLRAAIRATAASAPAVRLPDAQQLALAGGWHPPDDVSLEADLQRFASRVWGSDWPETLSSTPAVTSTQLMLGADLQELQRQLSALAAQLLQTSSS